MAPRADVGCFFGTEGTHAWQIARTALENHEAWSQAIDAWQKPIVSDESKPAWYRAELFNALYYLADGGTLWGHEPSAGAAQPTVQPCHKCLKISAGLRTDPRIAIL